MLKRLFTIFCGLLFTSSLYSAHILGAGISWDYLSGNSYRIKLVLIADCQSLLQPGNSQTVSWMMGTLTMNLDTTLTKYNGYQSNSNQCAAKYYIYYSDTVQINAVASNGGRFTFRQCCLPGGFDNTSASGDIYARSIMYPDSRGNPPKLSTSAVQKVGSDFMHHQLSYNKGKHQYLLKGNKPPQAEEVRVSLTGAPLASSSGYHSFNPVYSANDPLPDTTESSLNGSFEFDTISGIARYDIQNDSGTYLYNARQDVMVLKNGKLKRRATINNTIFHEIKTGSSSNQAPQINLNNLSTDTAKVYIGDTMDIQFTGFDSGQKVKVDANSPGFDSATFSNRGANNFDVFQLSSLNGNGKFISNSASSARVKWVPKPDNYQYGPRILDLYLKAQDSVVPGSKTVFKRVVVQLLQGSTVLSGGSSSSILTAHNCNTSLNATTRSGAVNWKPASMVQNSTALQTTFTGSQSAWVYAVDAQHPQYIDSIYVRVVDSSDIQLQNRNQSLYASSTIKGLLNNPVKWQVEGFPIVNTRDSLRIPADGRYRVQVNLDSNCSVPGSSYSTGQLTDLVLNMNRNTGSVDKGILDSTYSFDFKVNASANQVLLKNLNLFGIVENKTGAATANEIHMRLYNNSGQTVWRADRAIASVNQGIERFTPNVVISSQDQYTLAVAADSNLVMETLVNVQYPFTSGQWEFSNPARGGSVGIPPLQSSGRLVVTSLKFDNSIALAETRSSGEWNLYPNPAEDWVVVKGPVSNKATVKIYNLSGSLLLEQQLSPEEKRISIASLKTGFYIVELNGHRAKLQVK